MTTSTFKQAVAGLSNRPKAVIVSADLLKALESEKAIKRKLATPSGMPTPSFGIDEWFYDEDIIVSCDPSLDGFEYKLPPA